MREPETAFRLYALGIIHHGLGQRMESAAALRELIENHAETMAYQIAEVHAARDEVDAAFQWLERAYVQRDGGLCDVKVGRNFRQLHDDPRWGAFLKKMGLTD